MTLERFLAIRDFLIKQEPCDPPVNESEVVTILIFAEQAFRFADAMKRVQ